MNAPNRYHDQNGRQPNCSVMKHFVESFTGIKVSASSCFSDANGGMENAHAYQGNEESKYTFPANDSDGVHNVDFKDSLFGAELCCNRRVEGQQCLNVSMVSLVSLTIVSMLWHFVPRLTY